MLARSEVVAGPAARPPILDAGGRRSYVVRSGDSIERIAMRFSVDQQTLLVANAITNRNLIVPGQTLQIPEAADHAATSGDTLVAANAPPLRTPTSAARLAAVSRTAIKPAVPTFAATVLDEEPIDIATEDLAAALTPAVLANGATAQVQIVDAGDEPSVENVLASEQVALAADPSDYTVSVSKEIQVQALETLGHYSDWLEIPTQRLRSVNKLAFRENVVIGQMLALDFSRVDTSTFEQRRVAYHQQRQSDFFAAYHIEDIESHVIKAGESLWVLAERTYKVPVWLLRQYNPDLNLDKVVPGAVVKFPRLRAINGETTADTTVQVVADSAN
jgi:membrane-bound lytic murein transglycosylase D